MHRFHWYDCWWYWKFKCCVALALFRLKTAEHCASNSRIYIFINFHHRFFFFWFVSSFIKLTQLATRTRATSRLTMKYWNHFQNKLSKHSKIIRFRFDLKIGELTKKCFVAYCFGFHHLGPYFRPLNAFQLYRRCFYDFLWIGFNYCAAARLQHSFLTFLNTKNHSH